MSARDVGQIAHCNTQADVRTVAPAAAGHLVEDAAGALVATRVVVAGVGYQFLRDLSVGPALVPTLRALDWPSGVDVDDWSVGPVALVQQLEDRPGYYDRVVLVSAAQRGGPPGAVRSYRWDGALPGADEIQQRIGEAVSGVISLDNLLIIGEHFGVWPPEVIVVEVEPDDTDWGDGFTPCVAAALGEAIEAVRRAALDGLDERRA